MLERNTYQSTLLSENSEATNIRRDSVGSLFKCVYQVPKREQSFYYVGSTAFVSIADTFRRSKQITILNASRNARSVKRLSCVWVCHHGQKRKTLLPNNRIPYSRTPASHGLHPLACYAPSNASHFNNQSAQRK